MMKIGPGRAFGNAQRLANFPVREAFHVVHHDDGALPFRELCQRLMQPFAELAHEAWSESTTVRLADLRAEARRAIGEQLALKIALDRPELVEQYLRTSLYQRQHEVFVVLFLDVKNRLLANSEMFRGTLTHTSVYPRSIRKSRPIWVGMRRRPRLFRRRC